MLKVNSELGLVVVVWWAVGGGGVLEPCVATGSRPPTVPVLLLGPVTTWDEQQDS